jgi:ribose transport system substrate-binding protein
MEKMHVVTKYGLTRRACLYAGLTLAITIFGGAFGVASVARGAEGSAKGKTVGYITFGLQFEYQVAMVEGIKKKAMPVSLFG